jgi:AcrR family transcriptional regulator
MSKGELRRQQIVETAFDEASTLGLEGITLGVLAEKLELSKSGLFAHFASKEELQRAVLDEAIRRFIAQVVRPALTAPRGEPRVVALFHNWQGWVQTGGRLQGPARRPGADVARGCFFMSLSAEYDDRPGPVRDALVASQRDWLAAVSRAAGLAVAEGHFRADLDVDQFAYEFTGIGMALQYALKLVEDPQADARAERAFADLLARARPLPAGR